MHKTHLESGVTLTCGKCRHSKLHDPVFIATGIHHSVVAAHLAAIGESLGWQIVANEGQGMGVCPVCIGGAFDSRCKCPMCGHAKVATRFCAGNCARGVTRRHLHRVCERCRYDWMQETSMDSAPVAGKKKRETHEASAQSQTRNVDAQGALENVQRLPAAESPTAN